MSANRKLNPDWFTELEDVLQCPLCLKSFREPPIYLCENLHGMCLNCRTIVMNPQEDLAVICCPVCQGKLTEKRSFYVEKILNKMIKNCKNCDFKTTDKDLANVHEAMCEHRLVPCDHCNNRICLSKLTQHLDEAHKHPPMVALISTRFPIGFNHSGMWPLSVKDISHQFYLHLTSLDDGVMLVWVSCSLPSPGADNYRYTVNVTAPWPYKLRGQCVSCDASACEVKKMGKAVYVFKEAASAAWISLHP